MRPIDGDKLIEEANKDGAYGYVSVKEIADAPTIEPYGTWIPCSERLPKDAEEYHVTQYNKNAVTEYCDGYRTARIFFDDNGWWDDIDVLAGWEIIAWMPLPEPYREE